MDSGDVVELEFEILEDEGWLWLGAGTCIRFVLKPRMLSGTEHDIRRHGAYPRRRKYMSYIYTLWAVRTCVNEHCDMCHLSI